MMIMMMIMMMRIQSYERFGDSAGGGDEAESQWEEENLSLLSAETRMTDENVAMQQVPVCGDDKRSVERSLTDVSKGKS